MTARWRSALSASLAVVVAAVACASAPAAPTCDAAAVKRALTRTAAAINTQRPQLLAQAYELFPTAAGAVVQSPYALRIARPVGKPSENKQVAELVYVPGAKGATLIRALGRVSQLGRWSVGDHIDVGHGRRLVGITAEFFVAGGAAKLHYYGKGGFDCKTQRIFILAPLRQRGGA